MAPQSRGAGAILATAPEPPRVPAAPLRIACSEDRPDDAFAAVSYRGHWFWIDDRDLRTKRAFALLMLLFTLADSGERDSLPRITFPAQ